MTNAADGRDGLEPQTLPEESLREEEALHEIDLEAEVIPEEAIHEEVKPKEISARDAANWAKQVSTLTMEGAPADAINRNVTGRRVMSPIQGFGQMWQKSYRVTLDDDAVGPERVISEWKQNFPNFWPENNRFFGPLTGIAPGEVALLNLTMPGRLKLSTGVLVLYADEESFTLMTPQGHMFAGWITFSSFVKNGRTTVQAQVLMRANDPIYEVGLIMGGHKKEDLFWEHTLRALAAHFGCEAEVETRVACVDDKRQWARAGNIWHNSAVRSGAYAMGAPVRALKESFRRT